MNPPIELHKGLKQRHVTMIALGGAIGAGLFIGSGTLIKTTGPAAFVTSALTGAIIVLVMRMLAEMAVARPSTGMSTLPVSSASRSSGKTSPSPATTPAMTTR